MKIIVHADMNAFFASCEENANSILKNKPIAVCGKTTRSVVSSANYIARSYGVKSAMPCFQAKKICPNIIFVNHNINLYRKYSKIFFSLILEHLSNKIEMLSIDECYIDISDITNSYEEAIKLIKKMQNIILKKINIGVSFGISYNKFLSKMGSDLKKPLGITLINQKNYKNVLWPIKIDDMYMVGKSSAEKLKKINIKTIGDLANYQDHIKLKNILGKNWLTHYQHANGIGDDKIQSEKHQRKSIGVSETFLSDTNNYQELKNKLKELCIDIYQQMKDENVFAKNISICIKDTNFKLFTRSKTYHFYIDVFEKLFVNVMMIFDEWYNGKIIRLIGVSVSHLEEKSKINLENNLFSTNEKIKENEIFTIKNEINKKLKKNLVHLAKDKLNRI